MKIRLALSLLLTLPLTAAEPWTIDSQDDWTKATAEQTELAIADGQASPKGKTATFTSKVQRYDSKRKASSLVLDQSPIWQNWKPIANLGPANLADAPVFLVLGPDDYWAFGRYGRNRRGNAPPAFEPAAAKLEGFDIPLQTTRWPNQFNAPGGLKKSKGGYHAWQSRDMVNWVHHGPVTEGFSRWVTSAEHIDGKTYIYYDYPNDQDPHVYVDENLTDGEPGKNMGLAVDDPSHGSDAGFIRGHDGLFHVIIEDWSPINASKRSWDSPLAGHAVSKDGIKDWKFVAPAVDNRTKATGKMAQYKHPHWLQHPKWKTNIGKYEIHEPEQEAYGDWAAICVGTQYYLFGDYDPAGGHQMAVGWFTSSDINKPFTWCDKIGKGHPDPDIGFAEGQFYLFTQQKTDYVSPGPWVETVEARAGVDTDDDGQLDKWTEWKLVSETYNLRKGFSKVVDKTAAKVDLTSLPEGHGFGFELRLTDATENKSKPSIDRVTLSFR